MATYKKVRQFVLVDGNSSRKAAAHFAVGRNSVRKILENPIPKKRKTPINIQHPVIGKFKCLIDQYLEINKSCHYKQKLTGKRILELLKNEHGYEGSIRTVTRYIARQKFKNKEIFIPLNHPMGEAQVDFGETYVQLNKEEIKIYYFCMAMCNSNKIFVKTYFSENTLAWCDGHKDAFEFFRGIPPKITYDNSSRIVKKINKNGSRELTDKFEELQSVYLFKPNFANKGKGNEKGIVEGNIGWIRRNCFSPKPQITSIDELNKIVLECCKQRGKQKCYGKTKIIDEIFAEERSYLRPLPQYEYEVFEFKVITADKFSTIRYANTSYSVPEQYAYQGLQVKGYVNKVIITNGVDVIAQHKRSYSKGGFVCDFLHYCKSLSRKINSFDSAIPIQQAKLPKYFEIFLNRLLAQHGEKEAKRYFIEVLQLTSTYTATRIAYSIKELISQDIINVAFLKQVLLRDTEPKSHNVDVSDTITTCPQATSNYDSSIYNNINN